MEMLTLAIVLLVLAAILSYFCHLYFRDFKFVKSDKLQAALHGDTNNSKEIKPDLEVIEVIIEALHDLPNPTMRRDVLLKYISASNNMHNLDDEHATQMLWLSVSDKLIGVDMFLERLENIYIEEVFISRSPDVIIH